jgi:hypothetical protein
MNEDEIEKQNGFVYFVVNGENEGHFLEYSERFLIQWKIDDE